LHPAIFLQVGLDGEVLVGHRPGGLDRDRPGQLIDHTRFADQPAVLAEVAWQWGIGGVTLRAIAG